MEETYERIYRFLTTGETPSDLNQSQKSNFKRSCSRFSLKDGGLVYYGTQKLVKSKNEALALFKEVHTLPTGGHSGIKKTISTLSSRWYWPGMTVDITNWIMECEKCRKVGRPLISTQPLQCIKNMPNCVVNGCTPKSREWETGVILHTFPKDRNMIKRWLQATGQEYADLDKEADKICESKHNTYRMCSLHFSDDYYLTNPVTGKKKLMPIAVPSIFQPKVIEVKATENVFFLQAVKRKRYDEEGIASSQFTPGELCPTCQHVIPHAIQHVIPHAILVQSSEETEEEEDAPAIRRAVGPVRGDRPSLPIEDAHSSPEEKPSFSTVTIRSNSSKQESSFHISRAESGSDPAEGVPSHLSYQIVHLLQILSLTLEVIYLLTGEDYKVVKKSGECVTQRRSKSPSPIMAPPPQRLIRPKDNEQKILEFINEILKMLTGELDEHITVKVEETERDEEYYRGDVPCKEEETPMDIGTDGSYRNDTPKCNPSHLHDVTSDGCENNQTDEHITVKEGDEEYYRGDVPCKEEEIPAEIRTDGSYGSDSPKCNPSHLHGVTADGCENNQVQARSLLWDNADVNHSNRMRIQNAWEEVANGLFSNFSEMSEHVQGDVKLRKRWKSTRDYFMKSYRNKEASGASPTKKPNISYEEQLRFLLPTRKLRPTQGNYQSTQSTQQPPALAAASDVTPVLAVTPALEVSPGSDVYLEEDLPNDSTSTANPAPAVESGADDVTSGPTQATSSQHPDTLTSSPPINHRGRRTLRIMDKQLEVESEALSFIRRVDGNDESDFFGYILASRSRQLSNQNRPNFMAFCLAAATVFSSERPLPPVEDFIKNLREFAGERPSSPRGITVATQTNPQHFT